MSSVYHLFIIPEEGIPRVPSRTILQQYVNQSYSSATLYFVRSCGLEYLGPSLDPIFPADLETDSGHWIDSSDAVHILGCDDVKEVCDSTGSCYQITAEWDGHVFAANKSDSEAAVLTLMALSLQSVYSFLDDKIPELLADQYRTSNLSLALSNVHWQAEVRRLFEISNARLQIGVTNIARGRYSDEPGFWRLWPASSDEFCPGILIRTNGWRNLNLLELVCFSTFLLFLWISTVKYGDEILLVLLHRRLMGPLAQLFAKLIKGLGNLVIVLVWLLESTYRLELRLPRYKSSA